MRRVYLDNAATSPVRPEVVEAMLPYFSDIVGNASSLHMFGQRAKRALEEARRTVAGHLGAGPNEIYFTSGGTESNNLAIDGAVRANRYRGRHLITSTVEHHSVLNLFRHLETEGYEVTRLPVDSHGLVDLNALEHAIRDDTILVSVMLANNEVGTVQPLSEVASIARKRGALVHTDAVQAVGKMRVDVGAIGADLLSLTAHKFHGPKGAGALYVRVGTHVVPLLYGGHQERVLRPGTENIPGIVGLSAALHLACQELDTQPARLLHMRKRLEVGLRQRISHVYLNGHPERRLPNILNMSFAHVEGESLLLSLDTKGIAVSTGSACTAGSEDASHVLLAMGVDPLLAQGSLRFSLGHDTSEEDIEYVLDALVEIVDRLRAVSPVGHSSVEA